METEKQEKLRRPIPSTFQVELATEASTWLNSRRPHSGPLTLVSKSRKRKWNSPIRASPAQVCVFLSCATIKWCQGPRENNPSQLFARVTRTAALASFRLIRQTPIDFPPFRFSKQPLRLRNDHGISLRSQQTATASAKLLPESGQCRWHGKQSSLPRLRCT